MGFKDILRRIFSDEVRATPPPDDDFWYTSIVTAAQSGVMVTPDKAMQVAAVYACVRILAETLASLPLIIYKRRDDGGKERATNHPLYEILKDRPNEYQTSFEWREMMQGHLALRGNAYCEIIPGPRGAVDQLWPLHPDNVEPELREDGTLWYKIRQNDGTYRELKDVEVFHLPGLAFNGIKGLSPIEYQKEAIGLSIAMEGYGARFFKNSARPGGVLQTDAVLKDDTAARLKKSWQAAQGQGNEHKVAILEAGLKWQNIGMTNEDSQFLETRKYQRSEIASIFRVPPHMIGDLERATFCLPGDVEVLTLTGPKKISDIRIRDKVWSLSSDSKWKASRVIRSLCTGVDEILEIKTTNRTLRVNKKHRILVRRKHPDPQPGMGGYQKIKWKNEWIPAGELKIGDVVVTASGLPGTKNEMTPTRRASIGFMEFLGLYLGDGSKSPGYVSIARASHASYMDHYRNVITSEFVKYDGGNGRGNLAVATLPVNIQEYERAIRFSSVLASRELSELGFEGTAHTKVVPGWIFGMSDELKLAFLRGYLDADGSVDKKGRIKFSSCNEIMISSIRHLCISLGIPVTNLRCQEGTTTLPNGKKTEFKQFTFTCSDPGSNKRIGSYTPIYRKRLKEGKPFSKKGRKYPRYGGRGFDVPGCELSRINSIKIQPAEPVYDLEVDETHSFIANGVVVHNSNIEQQSISFVVNTMVPWLKRWEQRINKSLIIARDRYFAEFLVDGLLRGDIKSRYEAYSIGRQNGWLSANDIRGMENMNPLEGKQGDIYLLPMNTMPADQAGKQQDKGNGKNNSRELLLIEEAAKRVARKEEFAIRRAWKDCKGEHSGFVDIIDNFYRDHIAYVSKLMLIDEDTATDYVDDARLEICRAHNNNVIDDVLSSWEITRVNKLMNIVGGYYNGTEIS